MSVRPIQLISGSSPFCETFLDDVRVPRRKRRRRGERRLEHRQDAARLRAQHDRRRRSTAARRARQRCCAGARSYLGAARAAGSPIRVLRDRVTQIGCSTSSARPHARALARPAEGGHRRRAPRASIFKLYGTELNQRRRELMMSHRRPAGARLGRRRASTTRSSSMTRDWLRSRGNTIEGGTLRDPAQHHRQARARPAGLTDGARTHRRAGARSQHTAREFVAEQLVAQAHPRAARRRRRDGLLAASSGARWRELGWLGIVVPESYGGAGLGWTDSAGRAGGARAAASMPEPMVGTVLLGTTRCCSAAATRSSRRSCRRSPPASAARARLPGARRAATTRSTSRRAPSAPAAAGRLSGEKTQVLDGHVADWLDRVGAHRRRRGATRTASRSSWSPRDAPRLTRRARSGGSTAATPRSCGSTASRSEPTTCSARSTRAAALLDRVLDRATIGLCAEMLGGMAAALRDDARVPEDAQAVRRADRQLPGAQAPRGAHVRRARAGALGRAGRARARSTTARPTRRSRGSRRSPRRAARTPSC